MISSASLSYRLEADIAVVTLDDGKVNALTPDLIGDIENALERATAEAKAVLVHGRDGVFSAGFDLTLMSSGNKTMQDLVLAGAHMLLRVYEFPLPVVVACTGHAVAAGALLLLASDLRLGASGAFKIGLNEVGIGLRLPQFAVELARSRLTSRSLTEATLHATLYDPHAAAEAGFLDRVVEPDSLLEAAISEAQRLGDLDGRAYAESKAQLRAGLADAVRESLEADIAVMAGQSS